LRRSPRSTLFPYTTLFRSEVAGFLHLHTRHALKLKRGRGIEAGQDVVFARGEADLPRRGFRHEVEAHGLDARLTLDIVVLIGGQDRKSTRLNSSHVKISYA